MTRKREQAITALLVQPTVQEAARVAGLGERTLWRWLQDPSFQEIYRQARREAVGQAVAQLQRVSGEAVRALRLTINDQDTPASARVSAARAILELAIKAVELEDLEARLQALEKRLEEQAKKGGIAAWKKD
ncbi:MAG: hypothetical protein AB1767_06990 [Bacillota bacterium]